MDVVRVGHEVREDDVLCAVASFKEVELYVEVRGTAPELTLSFAV
jgi:hypothetical protein